MSYRHLWAVTRKEIHHIFRDRMTFFLVMLTPVLVLFVMAYTLVADVEHVPIAILDYDRSSVSRSFVTQITAGQDLDLYTYVKSMDEIEDLLMHEEIKAAVVISPEFGRSLSAMRGMPMQIIIDGTEPVGGSFAVDHIGLRAEEFINSSLSTQIQARNLKLESLQPIDLRVRTWYNPALKPKVDLIPGLISMVLGLPAMSVALTLAREREHGTLEQLMATPVGRIEILLGKMIPYVLIALVDVILIPLIAIAVFDIPFNGNPLVFFLLSIFFLFAVFSMGIVIGVFVKTQPGALALSFLVIMFPAFFLTGIFFPIVAMPEIMRLESLALPGTHYAIITRGVFLQGIGLEVLWPYAVMLMGLWFAFTGVAALFFRKKLD